MSELSTKTERRRMLENEKSTDGQSGEADPAITLSSEASASAKKHKKKKKKKAGDGKDTQQKEIKTTDGETAKQETFILTPDEQLRRELDWCIEQLELGLKTQKTSGKQREEASRALKTLRSSKAPLVKKRQVMRAVSGDYRKKIEENKNRQFKDIQSAMTSARVTTVSDCKPVFHRRAERNTQPTNKTVESQDTQSSQETNEHTKTEDTKAFVFKKTQEEFRFNFDL